MTHPVWELTTLGREPGLHGGAGSVPPLRPLDLLLLAHLAVEGPSPKDRVEGLFWPGSPAEERAASLARALQRLKEGLGARIVEEGKSGIGIHPEGLRVDVEAFQEAVREERWKEAASRYRGPFLDGVRVPGGEEARAELQMWMEATREELEREARRVGREASRQSDRAVEEQGWAGEKGGRAPGKGEREGEKPEELSFVEKIRTRRLVQVAILYLGFAWGSIEVCNVLVERGILDELVFLGLLTFHVFGLPLVLLLAWVWEWTAVETLPTDGPGLPGEGSAPDFTAPAVRLVVVLGILAAGSGVGWVLLQGGVLTGSAAESGDLPGEKHLAVLPFLTVGDDPLSRAFSDGLMETLTSKLTQVEGRHGTLWVVPASEIRGSEVRSPREALRIYGTNLVVTGSVQRTGDRVRITVNLVDAESLRQLRSFVWDSPLSNVAGLQDEIVTGLRSLLDLELSADTREMLASGGTRIPEAYDFYLQGAGYLQRYEREENLDHAIGLFERALEHDPDYVLALAGLGEAHLRKHEASRDPLDLDRARELVERALILDSEIAQVHVIRGLVSRATGGYENAVSHFRRALELEPRSAEAHRGMAEALRVLGRPDEAEATYLRAVDLRPGYWGVYNDLGVFYTGQGRYEEAAAVFRRVVELTPDNPRGYANLGAIHYYLGRYGEAVEAFERSAAITPTYQALSNLATLYFFQGRYEESASTYGQALELDDRSYLLWYNLAASYRWAAGREGRAREAYERTVELVEAALEVNPRDAEALVHLGAAYAALGEEGRARDALGRALEMAPDGLQVLYRAGTAYEELGDREEAVRRISEALSRGYPVHEVENAPGLSGLRDDARFRAKLEG